MLPRKKGKKSKALARTRTFEHTFLKGGLYSTAIDWSLAVQQQAPFFAASKELSTLLLVHVYYSSESKKGWKCIPLPASFRGKGSWSRKRRTKSFVDSAVIRDSRAKRAIKLGVVVSCYIDERMKLSEKFFKILAFFGKTIKLQCPSFWKLNKNMKEAFFALCISRVFHFQNLSVSWKIHWPRSMYFGFVNILSILYCIGTSRKGQRIVLKVWKFGPHFLKMMLTSRPFNN